MKVGGVTMQEIPTVQRPIPPQQLPIYTPPTYQPPQKPPRSRKRLWLIIGIIAAVLVIGAIGASIAASGGRQTTTSSTTQPTQQVTPQPTQPPTPQPTQPVKVQPRILGSIADFDAAYGKPYRIMTDQEMHDSGIDQYADRIAYYKIGNSHLLVASSGGTVLAIAGPKSVDYKQYFPESINAAQGPDEQTATTDIYYDDSGTFMRGTLEVDDNNEPWILLYTFTNVFPPQ
jgi:hypothetical protein